MPSRPFSCELSTVSVPATVGDCVSGSQTISSAAAWLAWPPVTGWPSSM